MTDNINEMKYFSIKELSRSTAATKYGIDNTPSTEVESNLRKLVDNVLDPLREAWGRPITVSSGYRCPALNKAVGGVAASQHQKGMAADISAGDREDNAKLFYLAQKLKLPYCQLIWEKGDKTGPAWIHISYDESNPKRQIVYAK